MIGQLRQQVINIVKQCDIDTLISVQKTIERRQSGGGKQQIVDLLDCEENKRKLEVIRQILIKN